MDQTKDRFRPDQTTAHETERRILEIEIELAKRRLRELPASSGANTTARRPPPTVTSRGDSSVTTGNPHARKRMETVHMPQGFQQSDPASESSQVPMPLHLEKNLNSSSASEDMGHDVIPIQEASRGKRVKPTKKSREEMRSSHAPKDTQPAKGFNEEFFHDVIHTQEVSRGKRVKLTKKSREEMPSSHEPKDTQPAEGFNEDSLQLLSVVKSFYSTLTRYILFFLWQLLFPILKKILVWLLIFVFIALPCILGGGWAICQVPVLSTYLRPCQLNSDNPLCNWNLASSTVSFCGPSNFEPTYITDATEAIPLMITPKSYESSLVAAIDQATSKIDVLRMRIEALHFPSDGLLFRRLHSFNDVSIKAIESLHEFYIMQDICMDEVGYSMEILIARLHAAHTESMERWLLAELTRAFIYKYVYREHYERTNIATMIRLYEEFLGNIIQRLYKVILAAEKSMQLFVKLKDIANDVLEAALIEIALVEEAQEQTEKMWFWQMADKQVKIGRIREQLKVVHEFEPIREAAHSFLSGSIYQFQTIRDRLKIIVRSFRSFEGGNDAKPEAFLEHMYAIQRQWLAMQKAKAEALVEQAKIDEKKSRKPVQQVNL